MADLFGTPAIAWDETGWAGVARDGRPVRLEISVLTQRIVAIIPIGAGLETRRSCKTGAEARAAAAQAIEETQS